MKEDTKRQLLECRERIREFMNEESQPELFEMCKTCENFMGEQHDFENCYDRPCFNFWLAFEYLEWVNSYR